MAPILAALIEPYLPHIAPLPQLRKEAVLIPIPLHPKRLRERGFNQSLEIAKVLSEYTGIPLAEVLIRKKSTWSQAELPHEMRQENVEEAFALKDLSTYSGSIKSNYLLLIDDVTTTGSTLRAAASAFAKASADKPGKQIWGATVARG